MSNEFAMVLPAECQSTVSKIDREWLVLVSIRREARAAVEQMKQRVTNIGSEPGVAKNRDNVALLDAKILELGRRVRDLSSEAQQLHSPALITELHTECTVLQQKIAWCQAQRHEQETWYQRVRQALQEEVRRVERELADVNRRLVGWACQDQTRLDYFIQHEPHRQQEALRQYVSEHPGEDVTFLESRPAPIAATPSSTPRPIRLAETPEEEEEDPVTVAAVWILVMVDERLKKVGAVKYKVSGRCLRQMDKLLKKQDHRSARARVILKALGRVTTMDRQQRQELNKLTDAKPEGWKIQPAGPFRLFLQIDEKRRRISFLVRRVNQAYDPHRHHV